MEPIKSIEDNTSQEMATLLTKTTHLADKSWDYEPYIPSVFSNHTYYYPSPYYDYDGMWHAGLAQRINITLDHIIDYPDITRPNIDTS